MNVFTDMRLSIVALYALLLAVLLAAPARAEKFQYRFRPGQVFQFRAGMAGASMMGQSGGAMMRARFRLTMQQTQRVRSVSGGVVTLETREVPVSGQMTAMGRTENYRRPPTTSVVRLTERGKFLSRKTVGERAGEGASSELEGADALYGLNFPDRELKPGDTWQDTVAVGSRKVFVRSRFVGRAVFRGKNCAKFSTTLSLPMGEETESAPPGGVPGSKGRMSGNVTTYFDAAEGVEVYSSGSLAVVARADLGEVNPEAGEFVSVTKINVVQSLVSSGKR